jgi:hypothetical protein
MELSENTTKRDPGESSMPGIKFAPGVYVAERLDLA